MAVKFFNQTKLQLNDEKLSQNIENYLSSIDYNV